MVAIGSLCFERQRQNVPVSIHRDVPECERIRRAGPLMAFFLACLPDYWPFGISSGMGMSGGAATGSTCSVCGRDFGNAGNS